MGILKVRGRTTAGYREIDLHCEYEGSMSGNADGWQARFPLATQASAVWRVQAT